MRTSQLPKPRHRIWIAILIILLYSLFARNRYSQNLAQPPADKAKRQSTSNVGPQAIDPIAARKFKIAREALVQAMANESIEEIRQAVEAGRDALGDLAGNPEVADQYSPIPIDARALLSAEAKRAMQPHLKRIQSQKFWTVGVDPTALKAPLRVPASIIGCMVSSVHAELDGSDECLAVAREAADFLMWAQEQAGAGCYPFPAARGASADRAMAVGAQFIERAEALNLLDETVRNGWAFEDHGDGGLQFDNGECGTAMLELYELTREQRYLDSALRAADWAIERPLSTNWNYNSFSVGLLAKAYSVTHDRKYLDAAVKKARLGVIPGQLVDGPRSGRWMDPHNARPAYHYIMLGALAQLAASIPTSESVREEVLASLSLGLKARNRELLEQGVMTKDKAMEALLLVQQHFADDPAWLEETLTTRALDRLSAFASEQARQGRMPLGPRGWGGMLRYLRQSTFQ